MKNTLLESTLELAVNYDGNVTNLCKEVGVTPRWFYKLIAGDIKNPGVLHIQRLNAVIKHYNRRKFHA